MCAGPFDCHYAAYGGSTPRGDMINGRVGSAFNDARVLTAAVADYVESDPYYQDTTVPLESEGTIISEGELIAPTESEYIYDEQTIMAPQESANEWVPDPNGGIEGGEIIEGTLQAPMESFEGVPSMPEVQLDDGIRFPNGSGTR